MHTVYIMWYNIDDRGVIQQELSWSMQGYGLSLKVIWHREPYGPLISIMNTVILWEYQTSLFHVCRGGFPYLSVCSCTMQGGVCMCVCIFVMECHKEIRQIPTKKWSIIRQVAIINTMESDMASQVVFLYHIYATALINSYQKSCFRWDNSISL